MRLVSALTFIILRDEVKGSAERRSRDRAWINWHQQKKKKKRDLISSKSQKALYYFNIHPYKLARLKLAVMTDGRFVRVRDVDPGAHRYYCFLLIIPSSRLLQKAGVETRRRRRCYPEQPKQKFLKLHWNFEHSQSLGNVDENVSILGTRLHRVGSEDFHSPLNWNGLRYMS